jgi:hypothetical protein
LPLFVLALLRSHDLLHFYARRLCLSVLQEVCALFLQAPELSDSNLCFPIRDLSPLWAALPQIRARVRHDCPVSSSYSCRCVLLLSRHSLPWHARGVPPLHKAPEHFSGSGAGCSALKGPLTAAASGA